LGEKNKKKCPNEGPGFRPRGDNHKNAKMGEVIGNVSKEPLRQNRSDVHAIS
jgi:hypothetical protein